MNFLQWILTLGNVVRLTMSAEGEISTGKMTRNCRKGSPPVSWKCDPVSWNYDPVNQFPENVTCFPQIYDKICNKKVLEILIGVLFSWKCDSWKCDLVSWKYDLVSQKCDLVSQKLSLSLSLSYTHTHSLFIYLSFSDSLSILWVKGFLLIHYDNWILSKKRHPEEKIKFIVWQIYNFFINCWMI